MGTTNAAGGRGRRGALIVGIAVLLPIAAVALLGSTVLGADHSIAIEDRSYTPGSVTVNVDDLVTWQNKDGVDHTVTADGLFNFPIKGGGSHAVSFGQAGEYKYGCSIHTAMKGTITVLAEGGAAAATAAPTEAPQVQAATSAPEVTTAPTDALGFGGGTSSGNLAATLAAIVGAAAVAFGLAIRRMTQVR